MATPKSLSRVLGVFIEDLQEFRLALDNGDVKAVEEFFEKAKHAAINGSAPGLRRMKIRPRDPHDTRPGT